MAIVNLFLVRSLHPSLSIFSLKVKHLYTLGFAALQCPAQVGKRTFLLVQSILASNVELPSGRLVEGEHGLRHAWSEGCRLLSPLAYSKSLCVLHMLTTRFGYSFCNPRCQQIQQLTAEILLHSEYYVKSKVPLAFTVPMHVYFSFIVLPYSECG